MAGESSQTRVVLVNGETLIFQGNSGGNTINEINSDLLQQALQEVDSTVGNGIHEVCNRDFSVNSQVQERETTENVLAIYQEQGETRTIELTLEQAASLGLHFTVDGDENPNLVGSVSTSNELNSQIVYCDGNKKQNDIVLDTETETPCSPVKPEQINSSQPSHIFQTPENRIDIISSTDSELMDTNENQPITLIQQYVNGKVTYTVKLPDVDIDDAIPFCNQQFIKVKPVSKSPNDTTLQVATDIDMNTNSTRASIPLHSNCSAATTPIPYMQCIPSNVERCSAQNSSNISENKQAKVSYVVLPSSDTSANLNSNNVASKIKIGSLCHSDVVNLPNVNLSGNSRTNVIPFQRNLTLPSSSPTSTTNIKPISRVKQLGRVPVLNSNFSKVTLPTSSSFLTNVGSTSTGSNIIRVVAGDNFSQSKKDDSTKTTNTHISGYKRGSVSNINRKAIPMVSKVVPKISSVLASSTSVNKVQDLMSAVFTRMPTVSNLAKPLGSSENPIQLVQQGQTYLSPQSLTNQQMHQIMTVLKQSHLDSSPRSKNILYDKHTNTRIIYRVVYPEDLDLHDPHETNEPHETNDTLPPTSTSVTASPVRGKGRRGRPPRAGVRRTAKVSVDSTPVAAPPLEQDEGRLMDDSAKAERKKQLARTRCGRLSRPPRYMIKDYKRLHHLDFSEPDLDDSDGGYSDYQLSEPETEVVSDNCCVGKALLSGLEFPKRKISPNFRCPTCQKIYLGQNRMARHLQMYPEHGKIDNLQVPDPPEEKPVNETSSTVSKRGRGKRKGSSTHVTPEKLSERNKIKLREALATCEDHEVLEVCGPALANMVSVWDFLLLRVEAERRKFNLPDALCKELRAFLVQIHEKAKTVFKPCSSQFAPPEHQAELKDDMLSTVLGLESGLYHIDDIKLHFQEEPPVKKIKMNVKNDTFIGDVESSVENNCPAVLSALTLVAKPTATVVRSDSGVVVNDVSRNKNENELGDKQNFLLPSVHVESFDTESVKKQVEEVFVESEQELHAHNLQTVDEIVNERLNNIAGGSTLEDFNVPITMVSSCMTSSISPSEEQHLADNLGSYDHLRQLSNVENVASFDPELALAAMGEGDQLTRHQLSSLVQLKSISDRRALFNSKATINQSIKAAVLSPHEDYAANLARLEHVEVTGFTPVISLAPIEECKPAEAHTSDIVLTTGEDATSNFTHTQLITSLTQIENVTNNRSSSYNPELALEVVEEEIMDITSESSQPPFLSVREVPSNTESFNSNLSGARVCEVEHINKSLIKSDFNSELVLVSMGEPHKATSVEDMDQSFNTEINVALVNRSVKKKEAVTSMKVVTSMDLQSHIAQSVTCPSFDPVGALSIMGDEHHGVINTQARTLRLPEPELMEVNLDENSPELDFDTFSEEFNRNTHQR